MPTSTKYREKSSTYPTRNFYDSRTFDGRRINANTSSAYDYPFVYPERKSVQPKEVPLNNPKVQPRSFAKASAVKAFLCVIGLMVLCFSVIYRYSVILESNQEIKVLEKEYINILSQNQVMQSKIDKYLEMGEVEKIAKSELGMMKPEANQIFYIDMKLNDLGGVSSTSEKEGNRAITGTPGALINAFKIYQSYSR